MSVTDNNFLIRHKKFRIDSKKLAITFTCVAVIVAVVVFWWLKLTGITVTGEALCGIAEHTHDDTCYTQELICGYTEDAENFTEKETIEKATEETTEAMSEQATVETAVQATEEVTAEESTDCESVTDSSEEETTAVTHIHTDECYTEAVICHKAEHIHSSDCFPDATADIETVSDWLSTLEKVEITNNIPENLIAVASSQLGYEESQNNFKYDENGNKNGYTRYGEWYGNPYGKWNTLFVSFCLHFSNIKDASELKSAGAQSMSLMWQQKHLFAASDEHSPQRGDIVFLDNNLDGTADTVGIILSVSPENLLIISGDSNNKVENSVIAISDNIIGYGLTNQLTIEEDMEASAEDSQDGSEELLSPAPFMLTNTREAQQQSTVFDPTNCPEDVTIEGNVAFSSNLGYFLCNVSFKTQSGETLENNGTVYIGESYVVTLEFSEINTGEQWLQFRHHDEDVDIDKENTHHYYLHYQIPEYLHCEPFTEWHSITAKTENGTIANVGKYFVNEDGYLLVQFYEVEEGVCFGTKFSNVDFVIDFSAQVGEMDGEEDDKIDFGNSVDVQFNVNGGAVMQATKSHGSYDSETHTVEYTLKVEAVNGVVHNLVVDDQIYDSHHVLRDSIVVTDLDGNILDPQPVISDSVTPYATGGFSLSGFPSFAAGNGYLITYKSEIDEHLLSNDKVGLWNGLYTTGNGSDGTFVDSYTQDWDEFELEKLVKNGKQVSVTDNNGNTVNLIEWEVAIRKNNQNLEGTVIIDTLGEGLDYYTDKDIYIVHYDLNGNRLNDIYLSWDNVTITGNSMNFKLPEGYMFDIYYYTLFDPIAKDETKKYSNRVSAEINGINASAGGSADVVGFVPRVSKSSSGDDGEYAHFTIETDVPGVIANWGNFHVTDMASFWNYDGVNGLYVENRPEDMVITAVTESGRTITFTPYVPGGPTENTYILSYPSEGNQQHSFKIFFNTSVKENSSSTWLLTEDSKLTISYKIPFTAKTGTEWNGDLSGDKTVGDILINEGKNLANEVYLNYTDVISTTASATYSYSPKIAKNSVIHEDGTIDYTVVFNNSIPGTDKNKAYLNSSTISSFFTDTFDNRLEYVEGSLTLTCYDPWKDYLWLNKYTYNGAIEGNSINIPINSFTYSETNPEAVPLWYGLDFLKNAEEYYDNIGGGRYVFTYTLKLKDEYLYSPDSNILVLDNTAEILWDTDKTSGPATETTYFKTGNLDKQVVQKDNELDFYIHVNRNALDILPGADTLTIEDIMTPNISVYWNTIKLFYEDKNGNWTEFNSDNSAYTYEVTYDQVTNKLTFTVPDSLHIRIDYSTLITENGLVSVENSVEIIGKAQVSDIIDAVFKVEEYSGGASGSMNEITLLKQDGDSNLRLPGVTFYLYGLVSDLHVTTPEGVPPTIIADNGKTLSYIGEYTTGDDGTVLIRTQYLSLGGPYALVEKEAPEGYNPLEKPVYFYYYDDDPNGIIQTVTTIIAIENYTYGFALPETGGMGTLPLTIIGSVLMTAPILYIILRLKRGRRSEKTSP